MPISEFAKRRACPAAERQERGQTPRLQRCGFARAHARGVWPRFRQNGVDGARRWIYGW